MSKAAIWSRVSTGEQTTENQIHALREWARQRGFAVVQEWEVEASAANGAHRAKLEEVKQGARLGKFQYLLVWALDRLSREGVAATLSLLEDFRRLGVLVWSCQESWTETSDPRQAELFASICSWIAAEESRRRSERIRAGIARRRKAGTWTGRGRDQHARRKAGYRARWRRYHELRTRR